MEKRCILITGTIVQNVAVAKPEDPEARRQAYLANLKYYSDNLDDPIFFLENSTYSFDDDLEFKILFRDDKIKLIKFPISSGVSQGKGFQEFEMLDRAVKNLSGTYSSFIKISGRYQYININDLINNSSSEFTIDLIKRRRAAITSIFWVTFDFYEKYLKNIYKKVNDLNGNYIELIIYRLIMDNALLDSVRFFDVQPKVDIITQNEKKKKNSLYPLKISAANIERKLLRLLFINELYHK